jgi:hypothetical protein
VCRFGCVLRRQLMQMWNRRILLKASHMSSMTHICIKRIESTAYHYLLDREEVVIARNAQKDGAPPLRVRHDFVVTKVV